MSHERWQMSVISNTRENGQKSRKNATDIMTHKTRGCLDLVPTEVNRNLYTDLLYVVFYMPLVHPHGSEPGRGAG